MRFTQSQAQVQQSQAQVAAAEAQVQQTAAALQLAEVNLAHTTITSPIDGVVVSRDVNVGQTVAASLSAPTLQTVRNHPEIVPTCSLRGRRIRCSQARHESFGCSAKTANPKGEGSRLA